MRYVPYVVLRDTNNKKSYHKNYEVSILLNLILHTDPECASSDEMSDK